MSQRSSAPRSKTAAEITMTIERTLSEIMDGYDERLTALEEKQAHLDVEMLHVLELVGLLDKSLNAFVKELGSVRERQVALERKLDLIDLGD